MFALAPERGKKTVYPFCSSAEATKCSRRILVCNANQLRQSRLFDAISCTLLGHAHLTHQSGKDRKNGTGERQAGSALMRKDGLSADGYASVREGAQDSQGGE